MFDTVSDLFSFPPLLSWVCFNLSSVRGFLGEGAGLSINLAAFFSGCTLTPGGAEVLRAGTPLGAESTAQISQQFSTGFQ